VPGEASWGWWEIATAQDGHPQGRIRRGHGRGPAPPW